MKETKKFDNWIGFLSISVVVVIVCVFTLTISDVHLAKGTYSASTSPSNSQCYDQQTCKTAAAARMMSLGFLYTCTGCDVPDANNCYTYECHITGTNISSTGSSGSGGGNSGSTGGSNGGSNANPSNCTHGDVKTCTGKFSSQKCLALLSNGYTCDGNANEATTHTCVCGGNGGSNGNQTCYCNTCNNGVWESYNLMDSPKSQCLSAASSCVGTNAVTTWGYKDTTNHCPSGNNSTSNSTEKPTSNSTSNPTNNPTNKPANTNNNPQTGTIGIIVAWLVGISAIVYSLWYFKKSSSID